MKLSIFSNINILRQNNLIPSLLADISLLPPDFTHKANKKFLLLEARERLGGRTHTKYFADGRYVDLGVNGSTTQDHHALAKKQRGLYETKNEGKNIIDLNKTIRTYTGLIPKPRASLINIDLLLKRLKV
jgi:monoamine oxidase